MLAKQRFLVRQLLLFLHTAGSLTAGSLNFSFKADAPT